MSVEVASLRPEPPAAGSGLEALNVVGFPALGGRLTFRILAFGFWMLGFGFGVLDLGFWVLDFSFWVLDFGFWVAKGLGVEFWPGAPASGHCEPLT